VKREKKRGGDTKFNLPSAKVARIGRHPLLSEYFIDREEKKGMREKKRGQHVFFQLRLARKKRRGGGEKKFGGGEKGKERV